MAGASSLTILRLIMCLRPAFEEGHEMLGPARMRPGCAVATRRGNEQVQTYELIWRGRSV